ncbi:hypothetical protein PF008_g8265 [Phytophthora fragariae]|uniref:Uncharacterized protein n=1 Tax=Phytophthora fragariae TaxID=53985 RepID=A0A6G0S1N3_9STRA|nr:hypothetical protein PF008_g8265 [Phytophthora fragariae]
MTTAATGAATAGSVAGGTVAGLAGIGAVPGPGASAGISSGAATGCGYGLQSVGMAGGFGIPAVPNFFCNGVSISGPQFWQQQDSAQSNRAVIGRNTVAVLLPTTFYPASILVQDSTAAATKEVRHQNEYAVAQAPPPFQSSHPRGTCPQRGRRPRLPTHACIYEDA